MPTYFDKTCLHCNQDFKVLPRDKGQKFCSRQCVNDSIAAPRDLTKQCPTCKIEFKAYTVHNNIKKFCSQKCANVRVHSVEIKTKIASTLRKFYADNPVQPKSKIKPSTTCVVCGKLTNHPRRKTCRQECYSQLITANSQKHPKCGGQKHTRRSKLCNIIGTEYVMESSYEVMLGNNLNNNNILWIRPNNFTYIDQTGADRRYYPDFYLPDYDVYLDPKNDYLIKTDTDKISRVISQHHIRILILNKDQLDWEIIKEMVIRENSAISTFGM